MKWLALVALSGCGLFPSLSDLSGADAGGPIDASKDAAADATTTRFCDGVSPTPQYCEDFDEVTAPNLFALESLTVDNGASYALDTTDVGSAPRSLLVTVPAVSDGTALHAAYYPTIGNAPHLATLSFDAKVDPGDTNVVSAGFVMNKGTSLLLVVGPGGVMFQEGGYASAPTYPQHPRYPVDWTKGWLHFDMKLSRDASGLALSSLSIDGKVLETDFVCDSRFVFANNLQIAVGYVYDGGPAAGRTMRIDNIVAYDESQ